MYIFLDIEEIMRFIIFKNSPVWVYELGMAVYESTRSILYIEAVAIRASCYKSNAVSSRLVLILE